jgi:CspA family cold shock protein
LVFRFEITLTLCIINLILLIMSQGKVKFFNESKGYGFIREDETNNEYFVHVSGLIDEVKDDDAVEFDLVEGRKGLNAVNVKVLS